MEKLTWKRDPCGQEKNGIFGAKGTAPVRMEDTWEKMLLLKQAQEVKGLLEMNRKTERFGLALTEKQAADLMQARSGSLRKYQRVEFGTGIINKLVFEFCDSDYVNQESYEQTLERLQDIFYRLKNETADKMTDEEALHFMREQFDGVCAGDLDYLESTCLERMSRAIRSGSRAHEERDGFGVYADVDEEQRWDQELYMQVLREITWE